MTWCHDYSTPQRHLFNWVRYTWLLWEWTCDMWDTSMKGEQLEAVAWWCHMTIEAVNWCHMNLLVGLTVTWQIASTIVCVCVVVLQYPIGWMWMHGHMTWFKQFAFHCHVTGCPHPHLSHMHTSSVPHILTEPQSSNPPLPLWLRPQKILHLHIVLCLHWGKLK